MKENWKVKHDMSRTRLYRVWSSMKSRCYNKNHKAYHRYGGRGIKICNEWVADFSAFAKWAQSNGYSDELSIDRIDNDSWYSPENCRWVPLNSDEQQLGRNNARYFTVGGERKQLCELVRESGVNYTTVRERLCRGWSIEEAISRTPSKKQLHPNQPKHRSHWRYITVNGEKMCLAEAGRRYSVDPKKLRKLIVRGASPEDAIVRLR